VTRYDHLNMIRYLAIDYGRRRIGLAHGDDDTRIALPHATIDGRNDVTRDARQVADEGGKIEADEFVVGLPINMDDTEGGQAAVTRRFADELARLSGKPVHLQDERLSTAAAHEALDAAGVRGKDRKRLTDRLAARQILQTFLDRSGK